MKVFNLIALLSSPLVTAYIPLEQDTSRLDSRSLDDSLPVTLNAPRTRPQLNPNRRSRPRPRRPIAEPTNRVESEELPQPESAPPPLPQSSIETNTAQSKKRPNPYATEETSTNTEAQIEKQSLHGYMSERAQRSEQALARPKKKPRTKHQQDDTTLSPDHSNTASAESNPISGALQSDTHHHSSHQTRLDYQAPPPIVSRMRPGANELHDSSGRRYSIRRMWINSVRRSEREGILRAPTMPNGRNYSVPFA